MSSISETTTSTCAVPKRANLDTGHLAWNGACHRVKICGMFFHLLGIPHYFRNKKWRWFSKNNDLHIGCIFAEFSAIQNLLYISFKKFSFLIQDKNTLMHPFDHLSMKSIIHQINFSIIRCIREFSCEYQKFIRFYP